MAVLIGFYLLVIIAIFSITYLVFRLVRKRSQFLSVLLVLFILPILILFTPIPAGHSITILGEVLYYELKSSLRDRERQQAQDKKVTFVNKRFNGALDFTIDTHLYGTLHSARLHLNDTINAVYETNSKMIFSDWMNFGSKNSMPPLEIPTRICKKLRPESYWDLASEAEYSIVSLVAENKPFLSAPTSKISQMFDRDYDFVLPVYTQKATTPNQFSFRCVARSVDSPLGGWRSSDISLENWNAYQLSKML